MENNNRILLLLTQALNCIMRTRNLRLLYFRYLRQRRRVLYNSSRVFYPTYVMILDRLASREVSNRRFWALPRPQNWFSVLLLRQDLDFWWKQNFRVNRETFMRIVDIVRPHMTTRDSTCHTSREKCCSFTLAFSYWGCYRSISITLGMGESSAETYTQLFCDTMFASRSDI